MEAPFSEVAGCRLSARSLGKGGEELRGREAKAPKIVIWPGGVLLGSFRFPLIHLIHLIHLIPLIHPWFP